MSLAYVFTIFACGVHVAIGACYSFMGFSTCGKTADIDLRFPFTRAWFVVNIYHRREEVRSAKHVVEQTALWSVIRRFPTLVTVADIIDNGKFDRALRQAVDYLEKNGEVVELLQDPRVTYSDLYQSFKAHPNELLAMLDTLLKEHVLDEDIELFLSERQPLIRNAAHVFSYLPTELFTQYLDLMDHNQLSVNTVKVDTNQQRILETAINLIVAGRDASI